jgi:glycine C-acetyltransferase
MNQQFLDHFSNQLVELKQAGLEKPERVIASPQNAHISASGRSDVLNMCANNYLGLADHPAVIKAAHAALDEWGFGMASVRFICGTQQPHKELEQRLSKFLGTSDTILYSSCFDANGGLFETLLGPEDAIISDELNHASIIDGIRLCKAQRFRYKNNNLADLEARLIEAKDARFKMIATDGVFSMDGIIADLPGICELADKYGALVMMDDCHSTGFLGKTGRGTHEHHGCLGRLDLLTGTLGKAVSGGSGGYISGHAPLVAYLRQRSRPYLFSNSLAPPLVAGSLAALDLMESSTELRDRLMENTKYFRAEIVKHGFTIIPGEHPIVPIMLGDAALAAKMSEELLAEGVYVIGFSYPVVPMGKARIRTQMSAAHTRADLDLALAAFAKVKGRLGI